MQIVEERPEHRAAVRSLLVATFGGEAEARLAEELRLDGDAVLSLVALLADGSVVGHILLSRLRTPQRALALAPLAVEPRFQRRGIGGALVRQALAAVRETGDDIVFVLGDPAYYERFGFSRDLGARYPCRYGGDHFQALPLRELAPVATEVAYPPAFDRLD